jgi:hypothetical protein
MLYACPPFSEGVFPLIAGLLLHLAVRAILDLVGMVVKQVFKSSD